MIRPKLLLFLLTGVFLCGSLLASAQTAKKSNTPANDCAGAWTGVVTYTRTQTQTDNKTVDRITGRGKDTRNWELRYNYKGVVGISETAAKDGSTQVKATITHNFSSTETTVAVEKNSCDRGKTWQEMTGTFTSQTKVSGQAKEDANVTIGLNSDGTYAISVGLPEIEGTLSGSETATYSGQCTPKAGKNRTMSPVPTKIQGNSLSSDGSHRIDPNNPNRLSGSYTLTLPGAVAETITWNLQKCGVPLRIIDLTFEDMKYPNWDDWQEINEQNGTVDGNWVRIKATIFNASAESKTGEVYIKETFKGDKWDGSRPDVPLKNQSFTVTLAGGEQREVEMLWDCSGYAWFDDGRARLVQRIKAEAWENAKKADEMTKNLTVRPRPVILVPGIWTNLAQFEIYQNLFTTQHSYGWKASAMTNMTPGPIAGPEATAQQAPTKVRSVYDNSDNLASYVDSTRRSLNAWHVDMFAHCTGGLAARLYVHKQMEVLPDGYPVVKHLMLAGTPNNGIRCAESMWYLDAIKNNPQTAKELMPDEIALFNKYVTQRKGTKFSALAGNAVPLLCNSPEWNDGMVGVESAKYGIEDVTLTSALHPDMMTTENFSNFLRAHVITGPRGTYPYLGRQL